MAQEIHFIHDLANLNRPSLADFEAFCRKHGITKDGKNFIQLGGKDEMIFFSEGDMEQEEKLPKLVAESPYSICVKRLITEADLTSVEKKAQFARLFLEKCSKGEVPYLEITCIFQKCQRQNFLTIAPLKDDAWKFQVCLAGAPEQGNITFEDAVDLFGILVPALGSSPVHFEWTKKCKNCGKFFQAKGPKTVFCSETCRSRARFQTQREVEMKK